VRPLYILASDESYDPVQDRDYSCYALVCRPTGRVRFFYSLPWYWDLWLRILGWLGLAVMAVETNTYSRAALDKMARGINMRDINKSELSSLVPPEKEV
jgi:hypothetical protein